MRLARRSWTFFSLSLLPAALALSACAGNPPREQAELAAVPEITLHVEGFSDADKLKILRAVNEWNTTGLAHFELASPGAPYRPSSPPPSQWTIESSALWLPAAAATLKPLRTVMVFASNRCELSGVIRHELGHVLGLTHTTHGLMTPTCAHGAYDTIDADTIATLAAKEQPALLQK
jgi:hypothetical protein